jgi:hypothetical protein
MGLYRFVTERIVKRLESRIYQWYYANKKRLPGIQTEKRNCHIVLSLTSFPARFSTLALSLKSALNQTMKPDVVMLVLTGEEVSSENDLPDSVIALKQFGLQIYIADKNLKPHNKYFYAMRMFPDSLIVTIDDDNMYDRNLVRDLYESYLRYPKAISAKRVHKITRDNAGNLNPYCNWFYEYAKAKEPSFDLLATGVGGVLYPPHLLPADTFDSDKITELCLNADDIWLKFMEIKNNISVVWVKTWRIHPVAIKNTQNVTLQKQNFHLGLNDAYIDKLQTYYQIHLAQIKTPPLRINASGKESIS